ncbi:MAG: alpha/beta hydrolase [Chloroflexi bacterium]|nr:alpha/beta hydrolase [Chloroflexota bacterium]
MTRLIDVPGGRLHAIDAGDPRDPSVVLLHAGIVDLRSWDDLTPLLVEAGYRVIRFDARGHGRTATEDVEFSHRADVVAVLDAFAIRRAALVGNSRGGVIAFDTAIESPDRVVAAVGVAAGLSGFDGGSTPEETALFERMDALETAFDADPTGGGAELVELDIEVWLDGPGQPPDRVPQAIREAVRDMDGSHYAPGRIHGRSVQLSPPAIERLTELRCPVLAIAGALDVSEVSGTAHHLEANAPNARVVILPGVAHMIGMETPEPLARLIIDFLAPLPRWG